MSKINKIQQDDINCPPPLTPNEINLELGMMYYNCT